MKKGKITLITLILGISFLFGEQYDVGDYVSDFTDSLCSMEQEWSLYDYFSEENGGDKYVIWLVFFNTNSRRCQLEASYTQSIHDLYKNQGLITVGIGTGWDEAVDCDDWAKTYGVNYPIINDDRLNIRNLFTDSSVPHHVIIDHNMQIIYTENNTTTISYELSDQSPVNINVIDLMGRTKQSIFQATSQSPGAYSFSWNANNFSSGVYFIELVTEKYIRHQKVLLVK